MTLLDSMPHTVRIERIKHERDEFGATRPVPQVIASDLPAWVQNASMTEINQFQKRDETITNKTFFPSDPGLRPGDHVVVTAGPSNVGDDLRHLAAADRSAGLGVLFASFSMIEPNKRFDTFLNA